MLMPMSPWGEIPDIALPGELTIRQENRLAAALLHIEYNPDEHAQWTFGTNWAEESPCGTAFCLAGRVVVQAGAEPIFVRGHADSATWLGHEWAIDQLAASLLGFERVDCHATDRWVGFSSVVAQDAYDEGQPVSIFMGSLSLEDLWLLAEVVTEGRVTRPDSSEIVVPDSPAGLGIPART